jgi:hypothetical protein
VDFRVYFNNHRQWLTITLHDVSPDTFNRWGNGRWGVFTATWQNPKQGEFGTVEFVQSRLRFDTISHEVFHAVWEWAWANRWLAPRYEERLAEMTDRLTRGIVREVRKISPKIVL